MVPREVVRGVSRDEHRQLAERIRSEGFDHTLDLRQVEQSSKHMTAHDVAEALSKARSERRAYKQVQRENLDKLVDELDKFRAEVAPSMQEAIAQERPSLRSVGDVHPSLAPGLDYLLHWQCPLGKLVPPIVGRCAEKSQSRFAAFIDAWWVEQHKVIMHSSQPALPDPPKNDPRKNHRACTPVCAFVAKMTTHML